MQRLNATQIAQLTGSEAYIGGLLDPHGGNIHPLNYALGLADAALAAGALSDNRRTPDARICTGE